MSIARSNEVRLVQLWVIISVASDLICSFEFIGERFRRNTASYSHIFTTHAALTPPGRGHPSRLDGQPCRNRVCLLALAQLAVLIGGQQNAYN